MNLIKPVIWIMVIVAVTFSLTGCTTARMAAEQQTPAPAGSSSQDQPTVKIPAGLVAADLASKVPECITVTDDPTETASMASVSGVVTAAGCTTSVGQLEFLTYATARGYEDQLFILKSSFGYYATAPGWVVWSSLTDKDAIQKSECESVIKALGGTLLEGPLK